MKHHRRRGRRSPHAQAIAALLALAPNSSPATAAVIAAALGSDAGKAAEAVSDDDLQRLRDEAAQVGQIAKTLLDLPPAIPMRGDGLL